MPILWCAAKLGRIDCGGRLEDDPYAVACGNDACVVGPVSDCSTEDQAVAAWNHRTPAEVPNQDKGYRTPMNTETAEKPKPATLVETFDLIRKHNPLTGVEAAVREALAVVDERFRTLDQERSK